jgi:5,6,7,8-tetrahydromethanopterin hydro-lyase
VNTQFGEAFVGTGTEAAHLNTVLGAADGPVETAWTTALATPRQGHAAFVASVAPGVAVRPYTLFVNKAFIAGERHGRLTWGPAHAGVAGGVMDAVAEDTVPEALAPSLLLICAVWVDPEAADAQAVYANNRAAVLAALRAGALGRPSVPDALAARATPSNAFWPA